MDFRNTKLWHELYGAYHSNPLIQIFELATNREAKTGQAWQAGLNAATRGDLAAVREYFSRDEVKWDLSSHGHPGNDTSYLGFLRIAAEKNNIELATFVLDQGVKPYSFTMSELKKDGINNEVTALLAKHVFLFPAEKPGAPKP
jgi:hypothetical protein